MSEEHQTRVEITAGGHQVIVVACESLRMVRKTALDLFRATDTPHLAGMHGPVGFHTELAAQPEGPADDDED